MNIWRIKNYDYRGNCSLAKLMFILLLPIDVNNASDEFVVVISCCFSRWAYQLGGSYCGAEGIFRDGFLMSFQFFFPSPLNIRIIQIFNLFYGHLPISRVKFTFKTFLILVSSLNFKIADKWSPKTHHKFVIHSRFFIFDFESFPQHAISSSYFLDFLLFYLFIPVQEICDSFFLLLCLAFGFMMWFCDKDVR